MIRRFFSDERGNYALLTVISIVPILGGLALGVDYAEMSRQRQVTLNALDASGIATARRIIEGVTDDDAKAYAKNFFEANLGSVSPSMTTLTVLLPQNNTGGGTLKLMAGLKYKPYFFGAFSKLMGGGSGVTDVDFQATSEIRLKNTLEVALVLDNSGSMDYVGTGSGKKRIELLQEASKQLVDTIAGQAALMKQISKPVQFALVPFSASVNVGPANATASWMDQSGISPIHHEIFDWTTFTATDKKVVKAGDGHYFKQGTGWGAEENQTVTRFTLYDRDMKRRTNTTTPATYGPYASWAGCVEIRPYPYNDNDATPTTATPATLFVPMFAPDEPGDRWTTTPATTNNDYGESNNWWNDLTETTSGSTWGWKREKYALKYFTPAPQNLQGQSTSRGPNVGCYTKPVTPLTDVSTTAGQDAIKASIDEMSPTDSTNIPEGMAWGWRVLSSKAPFTEGRPETEKGNDKVVIVLTDGANTYYEAGGNDYAKNKSTYSAYGYAGHWPSGYTAGRIFQGTAVSGTDYSATNYTKAMDAQFKILCDNAKAANVMVMTVSLDLRTSNTNENKAIQALKSCASDSRFRKDAAGNPEKLYWNATGGDLAEKFKEIANELSNLRIVG